MVACKYIRHSSVIIVEYMVLRDCILTFKGFLDLNIENDLKIIIDC